MNHKRRILRPLPLICCLASTGFLATFLLKFQFNDLWYHPNTVNLLWRYSDFWARLSPVPRLSDDECPYPYCPIRNSWNKSQFVHPFDADDVCPFYFNYIHEDLAPWATPDNEHQQNDGRVNSGITKEMFNNAKPLARFRVVIKGGRLYVDVYRRCIQTRAIFTIWGLLQLLKFYPGLVPDVELLFECGDYPRVPKVQYKQKPPPPLFRYCSTMDHFDISFPDWSFWGWPEVDIKPWDNELSGILKGGKSIPWEQRRPTAFWKGSTNMGEVRKDLMSCQGSQYAEIIPQNWIVAANAHYKESRLAEQCQNRFKIYVEGQAWSVSLKYIMACDSPVLFVDAVFHDFFSRGLMPMKHFWPIHRDNLCNSIKFGVEWGNNNTLEAETLGRSGQQFITKEVSMKHVYDFMFHALNEYAKLLRFEPTATGMREVCAEEMMCRAPDEERGLYEESLVRQASARAPCLLGPRDKKLMEANLQQRASMTKVVREVDDEGD